MINPDEQAGIKAATKSLETMPERGLARRWAVAAIPLLAALVLSFASNTSLFRMVDGLFFDTIITREPGSRPLVVLVESPAAADGAASGEALAQAALRQGVARIAFLEDPAIPAGSGLDRARIIAGLPAEQVPGSAGWRFAEAGVSGGVPNGALVAPPADYGLHRRAIGWLPGASGRIDTLESLAAGQRSLRPEFLVRLSSRQNLPRITAGQLLDGDVGGAQLRGMILLVAGPEALASRLATAPGKRSGQADLTSAEYRAAAIQTLAERRPVYPLGWPYNTLLLLGAGLLLGGALYLFDPKRIFLPLLAISTAVILGGAVAALTLGNLLLPVSALLALPFLAAPLALQRSELGEDRRLRRAVTRMVNYSARRALLKNEIRLPEFLLSSAQVLGLPRMLLFEARKGRPGQQLAGLAADMSDLAGERRVLDAALRAARSSARSIPADALVPGWGGEVRLMEIGAGSPPLFWLFALPDTPDSAAIEGMALAAARNYRRMRLWRSQVSAGGDLALRQRQVEQWVGSAASQIAEQGEQLREGLDGLETAAIFYSQLGLPLHANQPMAAIFELAGLSLSDTLLPDAIGGLAQLEPASVLPMLRSLVLHGGEIRVPCRMLDRRHRMLRIAAGPPQADGRERLLLLEALDISELRQLADLRQAVGQFLDSQLRNDLEAIMLATAIARDTRIDEARSGRVMDQIDRAAQRGLARLDELAPLALGDFAPELQGDLAQAYPVDTRRILTDAMAETAALARDLGVRLDVDMPELGGFTLAEPQMLRELLAAMLRIVIADTPRGEAVQLTMQEQVEKTRISVEGGIGSSFERLYAVLQDSREKLAEPYRAISRGMGLAMRWGATISYTTAVGKGYRFIIELRRIG